MNSRSVHARLRRDAPAEPPLRLMIVDDSSVARAVLARMLAVCEDLEVVAHAANAEEAIDALRSLEVDIVLLDVEMPGTSGVEALPDIIEAGNGARVLIVSSMAEDGAELTVRALAQGAADTLPKPGTGAFSGRFADTLADRIRRIGRSERTGRRAAVAPSPPIKLRAMPDRPLGCIALGASTGGLHALISFLKVLPGSIGAPILVTQHLPEIFMPYFAQQLASASGRPACVAVDGQELIDNLVHVAPGSAHLRLERTAKRLRVRHDQRRSASGCLPSVDPMLDSVAEHFGEGALGVMLSGMGRDGLEGSRQIVARGGAMLVQDQATCAIWGMPRAVAEAGLASAILPPEELARRVGHRAKGLPWK